MTRKCEVRINLHQKSDYLSIVTELNLQTISVQFSTCQLWKKMNTEALSAYLRIHLSSDHSLNSKAEMNDRATDDHQSITRDHWEVYSLSKIIKLSKKLLKSELLWSSNEIKTTANHIKNARYIKNMKRISETQWSQK